MNVQAPTSDAASELFQDYDWADEVLPSTV